MGDWIKQYLWVLDLVAVLLVSFFSAKLTSIYIGQYLGAQPETAGISPPETEMPPPEKESIPFETYQVILDRNIFDAREAETAMASIPDDCGEGLQRDETGECAPIRRSGEPVETKLRVEVFGVMVVGLGKDSRSSAIIKGGREVDVYAVGAKGDDAFQPNTVLLQVLPDRILFEHKGNLEYKLYGDESGDSIFAAPEIVKPAGGPGLGDVASVGVTPDGAVAEGIATGKEPEVEKTGENQYVISQSEVQNAVANMGQLYTEIRIVPNAVGNQIQGMKILSVKQGSLFDKLGLQRGDILERINGMEVDIKSGFKIFTELKDVKNLSVDLVRQGQKQSFEYEIR